MDIGDYLSFLGMSLGGESQGWGRRVGHNWSDLAVAARCLKHSRLSINIPSSFSVSSFLFPFLIFSLTSGSFTSSFKYHPVSPIFKQNRTNFLSMLSLCPSGSHLSLPANTVERAVYTHCLHPASHWFHSPWLSGFSSPSSPHLDLENYFQQGCQQPPSC